MREERSRAQPQADPEPESAEQAHAIAEEMRREEMLSPGAERLTNRDLLPACGGSREHEVSDVDARHEQQQSHRRQQHEHRGDHAADQIVLPLALSPDASEYRTTEVTRHLTTNIDVIRRFLDRDISCDGEEGATGVVRVGAGAL